MGKKHELLIDDGQLLILETRLAVLIGDRQAIALQQLHYWVEINRKAEKETHFFDDKWWVYNTWNEWHTTDFPFWSVATIRRVFDDLQKSGLVITRQHEDRNKGLWVSIDYDVLHGLTKSTDGSAQNEQTGLRKMSRRSKQTEQTTSTTENTETTTEKVAPNGVSPKPKRITPHYEHYLALVECFGFDDKAMTKSAKSNFMGVATELHAVDLPLDMVVPLYGYVAELAKKNHWNKWGVNNLAKYAPEFLATLARAKIKNAPPSAPILDDDLPTPTTINLPERVQW